MDVFQAESNDSDKHDVFVDLKAGVRLCIHNKLKKEWFVDYRRQFLLQDSLEVINKEFAESFAELCTAEDQSALIDVLNNYLVLRSKEGSFDNLDTVCQVTQALVDANKKLMSTTAAGRSGLKEQQVNTASGLMASLDLGSFSSSKKSPDDNPKDSTKTTQPKSSLGSSAAAVNFFEIMIQVNSS